MSLRFRDFLSKPTYVYHISPESDLKRLRATGSHVGVQARNQKMAGVYVAPDFKSAIAWGSSFVGHKKGDLQNKKRNDRLKEKGGGFHSDENAMTYKNLTIYKIQIPSALLKQSDIWSSRSWEPEYFIPEKYLDQLKIVNKKTYTFGQLNSMYSRNLNKRHEFIAKDIKLVEKLKTKNLAARYYLELIANYNQKLLMGKNPVLSSTDGPRDSEHLVRQKIEELKKYIFNINYSINSIDPIIRLDKSQESKVKEIYLNIKKLIESL